MSLHKTLEAYHHSGEERLERLLELYDAHFHHAGFSSGVEKVAWRRRGENMLRRYWKADSERRSRILYVEREFLFELGPHRVRGMVDRLDLHPDGSHEIVEYKTFEPEIDDAGNVELQLFLYGLGVREGLAVRASLLSAYYLDSGKRRSFEYDPSREGLLREALSRAADLMAEEDFRPDTSFCRRCLFRRSCPHSIAKD